MSRVTGKYIYRQADGALAYFKERVEPGRNGKPKEFFFYHSGRCMGRGGEPIAYNLPGVIIAKAVIFCEGEKQADVINRWGLVGTTFDSGGNSMFPAAMVAHFAGKRIAILRDNDGPGLVYAEMIAKRLHDVAEVIKIVLLPGLPDKGDICDWIETPGNDKAAMLRNVREAAAFIYVPEPEQVKKERTRATTNATGEVTDEMIVAAKAVPVDSLLDFQANYSSCLWHDEANPSLHHHKATNRVKCFSCGKGADSIEIVMKRDGVSFRDAARYLCGL